jgi:hypothetical protein
MYCACWAQAQIDKTVNYLNEVLINFNKNAGYNFDVAINLL